METVFVQISQLRGGGDHFARAKGGRLGIIDQRDDAPISLQTGDQRRSEAEPGHRHEGAAADQQRQGGRGIGVHCSTAGSPPPLSHRSGSGQHLERII
jgi:hypothetical protein